MVLDLAIEDQQMTITKEFKKSITTASELAINAENIRRQEICPAGEGWLAEVKQNQTLRIIDIEGNQAVDTLFISCADIDERYSATNTLANNKKVYLEKGSDLFTNQGRIIATITDDNCGRHDTLGGACSCESNTVRYAQDTYPMHSCRNNFMHTLSTHPIAQQYDLNVRHIGPNINFFMNVPVTPDGQLVFDDGVSAPGKYVDITAQMDMLVLISNCPQLNNPCNAYNPTPIELVIYERV